jgi:hypothetical protein
LVGTLTEPSLEEKSSSKIGYNWVGIRLREGFPMGQILPGLSRTFLIDSRDFSFYEQLIGYKSNL